MLRTEKLTFKFQMLTLKFVFSSPKGNELLTVHSLVVTGFVTNSFFKFIHRIINCGVNKLKCCINLAQKLYIVPGLSSITSLLYSFRKSLVWPFHSFPLPLKIFRIFLRPLTVSFFCTFSRVINQLSIGFQQTFYCAHFAKPY